MDLTQRLRDKVAVVTGGRQRHRPGRGEADAAEGAVVVIGDIDPTTGKAVADELNVTFVQVDVADEDAVNNLFDTAFKVHGGVDIAFNNAGISPPDDDLIENTERPPGRRSRTSTSRACTCAAALRHMVPMRSAARSSTPRRSSR